MKNLKKCCTVEQIQRLGFFSPLCLRGRRIGNRAKLRPFGDPGGSETDTKAKRRKSMIFQVKTGEIPSFFRIFTFCTFLAIAQNHEKSPFQNMEKQGAKSQIPGASRKIAVS